MKTTLELPNDLLLEAKRIAVERRITLKAVVEHALRRELSSIEKLPEDQFEVSDLGVPSLKKRGATVTSEMVYQMLEDEGDRS